MWKPKPASIIITAGDVIIISIRIIVMWKPALASIIITGNVIIIVRMIILLRKSHHREHFHCCHQSPFIAIIIIIMPWFMVIIRDKAASMEKSLTMCLGFLCKGIFTQPTYLAGKLGIFTQPRTLISWIILIPKQVHPGWDHHHQLKLLPSLSFWLSSSSPDGAHRETTLAPRNIWQRWSSPIGQTSSPQGLFSSSLPSSSSPPLQLSSYLSSQWWY